MDIHEMLAMFVVIAKRTLELRYELFEHAKCKRLLVAQLFHPLGEYTDRRIWR